MTAWRALRVVGGARRAQSDGDARGAVCRPQRGAPPAQGPLPRDRPREAAARRVSVIGPAGIGKSRLAWEFSKYIDGIDEIVYWHRGRSPAYGEGITFWALGEMVRERCRPGASMDDEATTRAKVEETVAQWVTDSDEREWIERALLTLLGVEGGMAADQLFGAWRTFFERIAEKGPVVLLFEDMHFADPGLLDFIDHLLDWSAAGCRSTS